MPTMGGWPNHGARTGACVPGLRRRALFRRERDQRQLPGLVHSALVTSKTVPAGVTALVAGAQNQVENIYPDFVPLASMGVFRSHFKQSGINGANHTGGACGLAEAGGDVGGAVLTIQGDQDYCAANAVKTGRTGLKQ